MKKTIITILMLILMLTMASCTEKKTDLEKEGEAIQEELKELASQDTLDGTWVGTIMLSIDGDKALVEDGYDTFVGEVDTTEKTIRFLKAGKSGNNVKFEYDFITDKLVLTATSISDHNIGVGSDKVFSLTREIPYELQQRIKQYEQQMGISSEKSEEE